jgi:uncharacterized membrane protein
MVFIVYMIGTGRDYFLFPALAGFMIVGPLVAAGLYLKSRDIEKGERVTFLSMLAVQPRAGAQVFFTGMLLTMLMLLWMRAAVILYALFFGVRPFPGLDHVTEMLLTTPTGWGMLVVGSVVGALFAGFAFAVSVFSIPMLLDRRVDALTAMGVSMAMVCLEQSQPHAHVGGDRPRPVYCVCRHRTRRADRDLPLARSRDLARLQGNAVARHDLLRLRHRTV